MTRISEIRGSKGASVGVSSLVLRLKGASGVTGVTVSSEATGAREGVA